MTLGNTLSSDTSWGGIRLGAHATGEDYAGARYGSKVSGSVFPPVPIPPTFPKYGISTGFYGIGQTNAQRTTEANECQAVGAKFVRLDCLNNSTYQSALSDYATKAAARGMVIMATLGGTGSPEVAGTFGKDMIDAHPDIDIWEIHNEPDIPHAGGITAWTPNQYADYVKAVVINMRTSANWNANKKIVAGALWKGGMPADTTNSPANMVNALIARAVDGTGAPYFNYISFHPYDDPTSNGNWNIWGMFFRNMCGSFYNGNTVRELLDAAFGAGVVPIIASEAGKYTSDDTAQSTFVTRLFNQFETPSVSPLAAITYFCMSPGEDPLPALTRTDLTRRPAWTTYQTRAV